ncbi:Putative glycosyltransferase, DXD sugar-binding, nucleotide-diphospho-sugar transferase [Septoria linicola]|uniref:Glycosyltransferase, DXD sugar-binding, nucleotide-diphospho-sugar transferase n=1 Tax=Septoria linicola TaxID=215465 RepID=A0A9Q9EQN9_9PEZI|nr:putative glycosyltransferase, DXD sugar-binding, nucleotide-diphospho-sugar transferase [Septoria linicola]USW59012.1 Putative glycosyltransferase, DXD sugar-binding, nucleotide-diphospho-sugar transferase [Septoria linicola]
MERRRLLLVFKLVPILYLVYLLHLAARQASFESFLAASSITFDDFSLDYTNYNYNSYPASPSPEHDTPPIIRFIFFENLYETHLDRRLIPSTGSKAPEICHNHNPDITITTWNATAARELLETHYPWFIATYDSYPYPIQRVDTIKYFVLYHFGGIYMDLDIAFRRSLTPLMKFPAWFPKASPLGVNNDLMASRAKHPVVEMMIHRLSARNKWLIFPYVTMFWSTSPQFAGDIFKEWWLRGGAKQNKAGEFSSPPQSYLLH